MKTLFAVSLSLAILVSSAACYAAPQASSTNGIASEYANSELPSWIRLGGEERMRFESLDGIGFMPTGNTYLLQRLRLNLDLKPLSWLKFSFQAQDSRVFFTNVSPAPASQRDPMDLRLGYVQIGNPEANPVSLLAGRQSLQFGEGRLVADPAWSNVGRSFDGVRAIFHYRKLRLDAFTGVTDKIYTDGFDTPMPGEHFDGLYGSIDKLVPDAVIEPYVFLRLEHNVKGELVHSGNLTETTTGLRWVGKLPVGLDYGLEIALQRGTQAGEPISAWAGHWVVGHTLPDAIHRPRLFAEYNRATGDRNPHDGVHSAFDTLFPGTHDKYGVTDLFSWVNLVQARGGFQYRLRPTLTVSAEYNSFWLANSHDGIYSAGKLCIASNGLEGSHIGQEPGLVAQWKLKQRTVFDFTVGHIFPGEFLRNSHHNSGYNSVVFGVIETL